MRTHTSMYDETNPITSNDDMIDSRTVEARIELLTDWTTDDSGDALSQEQIDDNLTADEQSELAALRKLAEEGRQDAEEWEYGALLVRESYFEDHARELADDLDLTSDATQWPLTCIDWERAARELQTDYTIIEFEGVTYYVR